MDTWIIILIAVLAFSVVAVAATGIAFAVVADRAVFGKRQDKDARFRYFTEEDFALKGQDFPIPYKDSSLCGRLYEGSGVRADTLILFIHGFGAGSSSYTSEIAAFVGKGYTVIAYDAYGCNNSFGRSARGFYSGAECALAACAAVSSDERTKNKRLILVGHSWGAYSALCAAPFVGAEKVVAISAFDSPARAECNAVNMATGGNVKALSLLAMPWFYVINAFKFGLRGNTRAAKSADNSRAKVLLVQGALDTTVPLADSAAAKVKRADAERLVLSDKGHNPHNTCEAEAALSRLFTFKAATAVEEKQFFDKFDWKTATRQDGAVMDRIFAFIGQ